MGELYDALLAQYKQEQGSNLYSTMGEALIKGGLGASIKNSGGDVDPWTTLGVNLGSALVGGLLQGAGISSNQDWLNTQLAGLGTMYTKPEAERVGYLQSTPGMEYLVGPYQMERGNVGQKLADALREYQLKSLQDLWEKEQGYKIAGQYEPGIAGARAAAAESARYNQNYITDPNARAAIVTTLGETLPPEQAEAVAKNLKLINALKGLQAQKGLANRFEDMMNLRKNQANIPGYEPVLPEFTVPATEAGKIRKTNADTEQLMANLEAFKNTGDKVGFGELLGQDAATLAALRSAIFQANRLWTNSGARFEAREAKLLTDLTPAALRGDFLNYLKNYLLGTDSGQFALDMMGIVQKQHDYSLFGAYGLKRADVPLDYYPERLRARFAFSAQPNVNSTVGPMSGGISVQPGASEIVYSADGTKKYRPDPLTKKLIPVP